MARRVIVVTGASRGIGRHLVRRFLALGEIVVGCSRGPSDLVDPSYTHHETDITSEAAVVAMFREIRKRWERVDVLVNNAGIASMNHALLTPGETAERVLRTNVLGAFLCCREGARLMRKSPSGRIVNFSTVAVPLAVEGEAMYAASKAAVETLTKVLAKELSAMKITVNAVGPTPVETELLRGVPKEKVAELLRRQAIPRMGTFEDVANVVEFFAQPSSDFVTGQVIYLGGVS